MAEENLVSIIISVYNNLPRVKTCLKFLRDNTLHPHQLILVDNASTDGTREFLETQDDILLIKNKQNLDDSGAINRGLKKADGGYILKTDTDVFYFKKGWLKDSLADYVKQQPWTVAGKEYRVTKEMWEDVEGRLPSKGIWHKNKWVFNTGLFRRRRHRMFERLLDEFGYIPFIHGGRIFMHKSVAKRVGSFDEKNFPHNGMEIDFSHRGLLMGIKTHNCLPLINGSVHYGELNDYGIYLSEQGRTPMDFAEKRFGSIKKFEAAFPDCFKD